MRLIRQLRSSLSPERFSMVLKKATRNVGTMGDKFRDKIHDYRYTYRASHLVWSWNVIGKLCYVDLDFGCSTFCPILSGMVGIRQKWQGRFEISVTLNNPVGHEQMTHPVIMG